MNTINKKIINIKTQEVMETTKKMINFVEKSFEHGTAAHKVEQGLLLKVMEIGYQALGLLFQLYGKCDQGEKQELSSGHVVKRLPDPHNREYLSVFGEYELQRMVYGTREGQKIEYVPLDVRLQLPKSKFSYLLQSWNQSLATETPYKKVTEILEQIIGLSLSVNSIERTNQKVSEYTDSYWDNQVEIKPVEKDQLVVGSADCKGVVIRKSLEEKQADKEAGKNIVKPASIESSSSKKGSGKKKMAVLGAVYNVTPHPRTADDVISSLFRQSDQVSTGQKKHREKPINKHVRASMQRDSADTLQPAREEIFTWLSDEVAQRNPTKKSKHILLMDGEEKLWDMGDQFLPKENRIDILDIIHACSYVWDAVQALNPKNAITNNIPLVKEVVGRILRSEVTSVIRGFKWQATHRKLKGERLKKVLTTCSYFEKNIHRMDYENYLGMGYPIASGVIEGACRNVVVDRMENSGMRWVINGAKSMLALRCIHLNGDWDHFMNFYIQQEQNTVYPCKPLDESSFIERMVA